MSMLVMVPARGHRKQAEALLESFEKNTDSAELVFILDPDDQDTFEGIDWKDAAVVALSPRGSLAEKLNETAAGFIDDYSAIMFARDDNVFLTEHWDTVMLAELKNMGGTGMLYPDNRRRRDIPEVIMISTDIIRELDFFAEPHMGRFYFDNAWADMGRRSDLLRFVPEVIMEHRHVPEGEHDALFHEIENRQGDADLQTYQQWRAVQLPMTVSLLRRAFNPDLKWLLGKV
jgi:hypothetical protein